MRRGFGVSVRVLLASILAVLALSSAAVAGESCVSEPDSAPGSHPGVVLGPATKCVRDDGGTTTADQVPAAGRRGEGTTSWVTLAGAGIVVAGFVMGSMRIRRRFDARTPSARAA